VRLAAIGGAAAIALVAFPTRGEDDAKRQCVASYEQAQLYRKDKKLHDAREELRLCARAACPTLIRKDCVPWLDEVERAIPTVVLEAKRDDADLTAVRVVVDGKVLAERLDGTALALDPGEHTFRYEIEGAPTIERRIAIREGEKNRRLRVEFPGAPRAPTEGGGETAAPAERRPIPAGAIVLAGVGAAGIATFGFLGALTRVDESHLAATCSPSCAHGDVQSLRTRYRVADVSLAVGVVALGAAAVWYLLRPQASAAAFEHPMAFVF
jgi:hypothetical protein